MTHLLAQFSLLDSESTAMMVERLGWTLVHSLWQFALISLVWMCLMRLLHRTSAATRYSLTLGVLLVVALMPIVTLAICSPAAPVAMAENASTDATESGSDNDASETFPPAPELPEPTAPAEQPTESMATDVNGTDVPTVAENTATGAVSQPTTLLGHIDNWLTQSSVAIRPWLPLSVGFWGIGIGLFLLRPAVAWRTVHRLRRQGISAIDSAASARFQQLARQMNIARAVLVVESKLVAVPAVIGILRPMVLLPASVLVGLTVRELDAIVAHELAHVRRHDYLVNMIQIALETIFFYHPAVWWMSHHLRLVREDCCDDLALAAVPGRAEYARSLVALEELRSTAPLPAVAANGGSLLSRVRRIIGGGKPADAAAASSGWPLIPLSLAAALLAIVMIPEPDETEAAPKIEWRRITLLDDKGKVAPKGTIVSVGQIGFTKDTTSLPALWAEEDGQVWLRDLKDGKQHLVARPQWPNMTPIEVTVPVENDEIIQSLRPMPSWYGNDSVPRPKLEVKVEGEGIDQRIHWRFDYTKAGEGAKRYDISDYDIMLVGNTIMARVIPRGIPFDGIFVDPGREYNLTLNWIDLVQSGLWISRGGEDISEPVIPVEEGQAAFRASTGAAVIVDDPKDMLRFVEQRKEATATIEFEKKSFFLGENLLTHFGITNHSDEPLTISFGGDYRGSPRHLRFIVEAYDADGNLMPDPTPNPMNMGGLGGSRPIAPGETYWSSLPLQRYRDIREAGTYTIKIYHDLGWDGAHVWSYPFPNTLPKEGHVAPIATEKLKVRMPNERQARRVLEDSLALPREARTTGLGNKTTPYAEFGAMNFPVYVPLFEEFRDQIDENDQHLSLEQKAYIDPPHVVALAATQTPEATRELIDLLGDKNPRVAAAALKNLLNRLPYPQLGTIGQSHENFKTTIARVNASWREEFREELMDYAIDVLRHGNAKARGNNLPDGPRMNYIRAGRVAQALARWEDYDELYDLHEAILLTLLNAPAEVAYPQPDKVSVHLRSALWSAATNGDRAESAERIAWARKRIEVDGETDLARIDPFTFMTLIRQHEEFRPEGWEKHVFSLAMHRNPAVRSHVLFQLPTPLETSWYPAIDANLTGSNPNHPLVFFAALDAVNRDRDPRFIPLIRQGLERNENDWVTSFAEQAINSCTEEQGRRVRRQQGKVGSLRGRFVFTGKVPSLKPIPLGPRRLDPQDEQDTIPDRSLVVGKEHGLANVVLFLRRQGTQPVKAEASETTVVTIQDNQLNPRVVGLRQGQTLVLKNAEDTTTNIRIDGQRNLGNWLLKPNQAVSKVMEADAFPFKMQSNIHTFLQGYVFVHDSPYFAITGDDGVFQIDDIPVGEWEIRCWHERAGWLKSEPFGSGRAKIVIDKGDRDFGDIDITAAAFRSLPIEGQGVNSDAGVTGTIVLDNRDLPLAQPWFWPDPYSHLGHVDKGGDGWRYLRIAGDPQAANQNGISAETQQLIAMLYREAQRQSRGKPDVAAIYQTFADQASELLTGEQDRRVKQLIYQRMSYHALKREDVAEQLDLSQKQVDEIEAAIKRHLDRLKERDVAIKEKVKQLEALNGTVLSNAVNSLKEMTDSRGPFGRASHKQVWTDVHEILSPSQRKLWNEMRGPMPESIRAALKAFDAQLD